MSLQESARTFTREKTSKDELQRNANDKNADADTICSKNATFERLLFDGRMKSFHLHKLLSRSK